MRTTDELAPPARPTGVRVVGLGFPGLGRVHWAELGALDLHPGDRVLAEWRSGVGLAQVVIAPHHRVKSKLSPGRVIRKATAEDLEREAELDRHARAALTTAREQTRGQGLKLFRAEATPGGRLTIYLAGESRVDLRALARDLGESLKARVELRQVGARDEAKMVGGIGSCGRELCCTTFLPGFAPVSIKMAKNQGLVLAPTRVSGQCGRLKCCLVYEDAQYVEAAKLLPKLGRKVETPDGPGRVGDLDVLRGRVRVVFEGLPPRVFSASELGPPPAAPAPSDPPSGGPEG